MAETAEQRQQKLAEEEDYDVIWGALYAALEADLSSAGWTRGSKALLESTAQRIEHLIEIAEG